MAQYKNPLDTCHHAETRAIAGSERCFTGPVAREENRAAHGCVVWVEECVVCGAQRAVAGNQGFREYGPWGPDAATRHFAAQRQAAAEAEERIAADQAAMAAAGVVLREVRYEWALVTTPVRTAWLLIDSIADAAAQPDNGDGLVPVYRGLLYAIERTKI